MEAAARSRERPGRAAHACEVSETGETAVRMDLGTDENGADREPCWRCRRGPGSEARLPRCASGQSSAGCGRNQAGAFPAGVAKLVDARDLKPFPPATELSVFTVFINS